MSNLQNFLISLALIGWLAVHAADFARDRNKLFLGVRLFVVFVVAIVLNRYFGYFNTLEFKGGVAISEAWVLLGLYVSTLLGILGQHVFIQIRGLNSRGRRPKFKWMPLIKPLIISPIVFLAVLNQMEQIGAKSSASMLRPVIVQFILAFQNGFFWKTVIEGFEGKKANETK